MKIGIPKEIKNSENRVGLVPTGVKQLVNDGHEVFVQKSAGLGIGLTDDMYKHAGATILADAPSVFSSSEMIIKVKEPLTSEINLLEPKHLLFTYLHLAADKNLTMALMERGVSAIAYETIQSSKGTLPLLLPMSEVAGRMSVQIGASTLQLDRGGKGLLLGGVPGVRRGVVTVIGCGVAGANAIKMAVGLGAQVIALDTSLERLAHLDDLYSNRITTLHSNPENIRKSVISSDLVIGAVLIAGAKAPKLVTREHLRSMEKGSVVIDIAVDQGGCIETCRPTTHENPTFVEEGIVHYCVANMPGAVAHTSTYALTNMTTPYARILANGKGITGESLRRYPELVGGINLFKGKLVYKQIALDLDLPYTPMPEI